MQGDQNKPQQGFRIIGSCSLSSKCESKLSQAPGNFNNSSLHTNLPLPCAQATSAPRPDSNKEFHTAKPAGRHFARTKRRNLARGSHHLEVITAGTWRITTASPRYPRQLRRRRVSSRHVAAAELTSAAQPTSSGRDPDRSQVAADGPQCSSPGCPDRADGH
jgi:hypothetical protein